MSAGELSLCRLRAQRLRVVHGNALTLGRGVLVRSGVTVELSECGRIEIGDDVNIMQGAHLVAKRHGVLRIEDHVFIGRNVQIVATDGVTIGERTYLASGVGVYDYDHLVGGDHNEIVSEPVRIGARCWLGAHVVATRGTVLADEVIVAANAVARGFLEARSVYGGVPARLLGTTQRTISGEKL